MRRNVWTLLFSSLLGIAGAMSLTSTGNADERATNVRRGTTNWRGGYRGAYRGGYYRGYAPYNGYGYAPYGGYGYGNPYYGGYGGGYYPGYYSPGVYGGVGTNGVGVGIGGVGVGFGWW